MFAETVLRKFQSFYAGSRPDRKKIENVAQSRSHVIKFINFMWNKPEAISRDFSFIGNEERLKL